MRNAAGGGGGRGRKWDEQISVAKTEQSGSKREREKLSRCGFGRSPLPLLQGAGKKLLPSVCISGRRQREEAGEGVTIGIPEPNLAECRVNSTPPTLLPQRGPEPH